LDYEVIFAHADDALTRAALAEWDVDTSQIRDYKNPRGADWYTGCDLTDCELCGHKHNRFEFPLINAATRTTIWTGSTCIIKYGMTVDGDACAETALARLRGEITKAKRAHAASVWAVENPDAPARLDDLRAQREWLTRKWVPFAIANAVDASGARLWTRSHDDARKQLAKWTRAALNYFDRNAMLTPARTAQLPVATATLDRLRAAYTAAEAYTPAARARAEWESWLVTHDSVLLPAERATIDMFIRRGYTRGCLFAYNLETVNRVESRLSSGGNPADAEATKEALDALPW
jgi:hypothetical protein